MSRVFTVLFLMQRHTDNDGRQKLPPGGVSTETAQGDSDVAASFLHFFCCVFSPFIVQNNTLPRLPPVIPLVFAL